MKLYFAYGSNLWREQMRARCPEQKEIGKFYLCENLKYKGM